MLTMICLVVGLIICGIIAICCLNCCRDWTDIFGAIFVVFDIIGTIVLVLLIIQIVVVHVNPEGQLAAHQSEKAMLEYRLDQKEYLNDNNVGMTELMEDITEYNSNLIKAQHGLQSPWVNWFYGSYANELTPIILDSSD